MPRRVLPRRMYCEYRKHVRLTGYVSLVVGNFALLLARRFDWMEEERSTWVAAFLGMPLFTRITEPAAP